MLPCLCESIFLCNSVCIILLPVFFFNLMNTAIPSVRPLAQVAHFEITSKIGLHRHILKKNTELNEQKQK